MFQCFFASPCFEVSDFHFAVDFGSFEVTEQVLMTPVYDGDDQYCQIEVEPKSEDALLLGKSFVSESSVLFDAHEHIVALWQYKDNTIAKDDGDSGGIRFDREPTGPEKFYLKASHLLQGPFKILLMLTTALSDVVMMAFDMGANTLLSPFLTFIYPFIGLQLFIGDKTGGLRQRMDPFYEPHSFYDRVIKFSHYLIFEAETILKIFGFIPKGKDATDMTAFTMAMAYGLQWSMLLPNCIVVLASLSYTLYPAGFWKVLHKASDWMAEHSRKKDDEEEVSNDEMDED